MLTDKDFDAVNRVRVQLNVLAADPRARFAGAADALEQLERALRLLQERDAVMANAILVVADSLLYVARLNGTGIDRSQLPQLTRQMLERIAHDSGP